MSKTEDKKSAAEFTSWKLDLLDYIHADPRLKPADKCVAFGIAQHVNMKTRDAYVSAETISDETCIGHRHVQRAIKRLKETGWLERRKTQDANIYKFDDKNVSAMIDRLLVLKEAREDRRRKRRAKRW